MMVEKEIVRAWQNFEGTWTAFLAKNPQRPEVKEYKRKYYQRPEVKERQREYRQRPEVKERKRELRRLRSNVSTPL